jgi:hypothetical protein
MTRVGSQRNKNVPEVVFLKHVGGVTWLQYYLQEGNRTERSERCTLDRAHRTVLPVEGSSCAQDKSLNTVLLIKQFLFYYMVTCFLFEIEPSVKMYGQECCKSYDSVQGAATLLVLRLECYFLKTNITLRSVPSVVKFLVFCGERVSRIEL